MVINGVKKSELAGLLYGTNDIKEKYNFGNETGRVNSGGGLYNELSGYLSSGYTIQEKLGVYATDDTEDKPDANKTVVRIIIYEISKN